MLTTSTGALAQASTDEYTVHLTNAVPFALERLTSLQVGRTFRIDVRRDGEPAVTMAFA